MSLQLQIAATESYLAVLRALDECIKAYGAAGMPVPDFSRVLESAGSDDEKGEKGEETAEPLLFSSVPEPTHPQRPTTVPEGYAFVGLNHATPTTVAVAYLRLHLGVVSTADIADFVRNVLPDVALNSVYNALNRVAANGWITKHEDGFEILRPEKAGIIHDDYIWIAPHAMMPTDNSWYRRQAIIHALRCYPGIQLLQLEKVLTASPWMAVRFNKDALKLDLQTLEREGRVRRIDGSRRWELAPTEEKG